MRTNEQQNTEFYFLIATIFSDKTREDKYSAIQFKFKNRIKGLRLLAQKKVGKQ